MRLAGPAPLQRCRGLQLAIVLGLILAVTGLIDRNPIPVVVGTVGAVIAFVVYRRECGGTEKDS